MTADRTSWGLVLVALVAACGSPPARPVGPGIEPPVVPEAEEIVIGHFETMTGAGAPFGISTDQGVRLAVDEQNAEGGIHGATIRLVTLDDAGKTSEAGAAVQRLIEVEHARAILGEASSILSLAGGEVAAAAGVPMIAPGGTNPRITEMSELTFQIALLTDPQAYAAARFATEMWFEPRVVLLRDERSAYSAELSVAFEEHIKALGGKIVLEHRYASDALDVKAVVAALAGVDADAIYLPGYYPDVLAIVGAARAAGIDTPFVGGDGWESSALVELGAEALLGCFYTSQFSIYAPEAAKFVEAYRARYAGPPDSLAALGYDAASLLFDAMTRAPSGSGADLAAAIAATTGFEGVTGTLSFGADRFPSRSLMIIGFVEGAETVWTRYAPPVR